MLQYAEEAGHLRNEQPILRDLIALAVDQKWNEIEDQNQQDEYLDEETLNILLQIVRDGDYSDEEYEEDENKTPEEIAAKLALK